VISPRSPWYGRLKILALLVVVILADVAVLISYRGFADQRVAALEEDRKDLEAKRDAAQQTVQRLDGSIKKLEVLQDGLERFYTVTLGSRKERLAALIDEIHDITRKAGLVPDAIAYSEQGSPGGETIHLSFSVTSSYPDVKRLLATFESSARFLVVDSFTIGVDQTGSDLITVGFALSHYFRDGIGRRRPAAVTASTSKETKTETRTKATKEAPLLAVPAPTPQAMRVSAPERDFAPRVPPPSRPTPVPRGAVTITEEAVPSSGPGAGPGGPGAGPGGGLLLPRVGTAPGVARAPRPTRPENAR
jgi:hypothetical protein